MNSQRLKYVLSIGMFLICSQLFSQQFHTEVKINKSSVYVGEPIEVTIGVFTTTWFTRGVDLGNISVPGAFSVYFRPVSQSKTINGKQFSGVELTYNVFPYEADPDFVFPSLDIQVESPPEGDYKGKTHLLRSQERKIEVKPVPAEFDRDEWLVANSLNVRESWSGNKVEVKVGDVLERRISRNAGGTVSELIPPIIWDSIPEVSIYPSRSQVDNNKTKSAISASRSESVRYLFEKEGKVVIPEKVFTWYNPYQKKLYKRTLDAVEVDVVPNPDLGVLLSVKDSLQAQAATLEPEEAEDKPLLIFGLPVGRFVLLVAIFLIVIYFLIRAGWRFWNQFIERRNKYRLSEEYFFKQFQHSLKSGTGLEAQKAFYRWVDELHLIEPSLSYFVQNYGKPADQETHSIDLKGLNWSSQDWEKARLKAIKSEEITLSVDKKMAWINP